MDRSREGLITKIRALVDVGGGPNRLRSSLGQAHDCTEALPLLTDLDNVTILFSERAQDTDAM